MEAAKLTLDSTSRMKMRAKEASGCSATSFQRTPQGAVNSPHCCLFLSVVANVDVRDLSMMGYNGDKVSLDKSRGLMEKSLLTCNIAQRSIDPRGYAVERVQSVRCSHFYFENSRASRRCFNWGSRQMGIGLVVS